MRLRPEVYVPRKEHFAMVAPIITATGLAVWILTALVISRTVGQVLSIAPSARDAFSEISGGRIRARHIWTAGKLLHLSLKGPRAVLAAAKAEVIRVWVIGAIVAAAVMIFAGSCFLFTGLQEILVGVMLAIPTSIWFVALCVELFAATKDAGVKGLRARTKRLPSAVMRHNTSRAARPPVFYGVAWFGLAFTTADLLVVGELRHFVL